MKHSALFLTLCLFTSTLFAQLNVELISRLDYDVRLNDVWGYTAPDGTEYALVGLFNGVSIVSLAEPSNPVEVFFIPGEGSTWRDLRTWKHYAYVTTDQPGTREGLLVIDLSELPDNLPYHKLRPVFPGETDTLNTCHNVWVDEMGFAYLAGCNTKTSNVVFLNLNNDPFHPEFAGFGANVVSHDTYARDNLFYSAEIFDGQFSIYNVTDKSDPILLASQKTPFTFTHNVWLSDDGKTIFTTDERANAPTAAYDISNLDNIRLLDEFRPAATLGTGVIPHNVHVKDDFLVISHYTDGCVVVDAHKPDNLVEVGHFDSSTAFTEGFHGAWGAYPFFPSGLLAVSDIENGLYILQPVYKRACYLEGMVTDKTNGTAIPNATIEIQSPISNLERSNLFGSYKTGLESPGTYEVIYKARGYFDEKSTVTLSRAEVTSQDIQLTPLPPYSYSGTVLDQTTFLPIEGARILVENDHFQYEAETDNQGRFSFPAVLDGRYQVYVGKWGYLNSIQEDLNLDKNQQTEWYLVPGYDDPFNLDLGWQVSGQATSGIWERGIPMGTKFAGKDEIFNPFHDSPNDPGNRAYVTGNQGIGVFDDEVQNGVTELVSPPMKLKSLYNRPVLTYDIYFYNVFSNNYPNDTLSVFLTNGQDTLELEHLTYDTRLQEWRPSEPFDLVERITLTDEMRFIVRVSDREETPNVVEGGLDHFRIMESLPDESYMVNDRDIKIRVYPNPFVQELTIDYKIEKSYTKLEFLILDATGRILEVQLLEKNLDRLDLTRDLVNGFYVIAFRIDGKLTKGVPVVKMQ